MAIHEGNAHIIVNSFSLMRFAFEWDYSITETYINDWDNMTVFVLDMDPPIDHLNESPIDAIANPYIVVLEQDKSLSPDIDIVNNISEVRTSINLSENRIFVIDRDTKDKSLEVRTFNIFREDRHITTINEPNSEAQTFKIFGENRMFIIKSDILEEEFDPRNFKIFFDNRSIFISSLNNAFNISSENREVTLTPEHSAFAIK